MRRIAAAALFTSTVALTAVESRAVFTGEQAAGAYAKSCASCHMPDLSGSNDAPPLAGPVFTAMWRARTTKDLFEYLSTSMPPGGSSLSIEGFESITAYILEANGASAGETPFRSTTAVPIGDVIGR